MAEVLKVMEDNFGTGFKQTEGFKKLQQAADEEAKELDFLRKVG